MDTCIFQNVKIVQCSKSNNETYDILIVIESITTGFSCVMFLSMFIETTEESLREITQQLYLV